MSVRLGIVVCISVLLLAPASWAQQASGIAGVVRDTSGGVLPGVTVEASSPALIEGVRTAFSDGEGRFNIVNLVTGSYTVTFSLPGFTTIIREGLELTAGFTASVNVDMSVGSLEETITVTGQSPLVDVQNVRQQSVLSGELLATLPTGQTNVINLISLTPGMTGNATVGASTGSYHSQQRKGNFHGKRGSHLMFDGGRIDNNAGSGDSAGYIFNSQLVQEMAIESGGAGADSGAPNVGINLVPHEGGNTFSGTFNGMYANDSFHADNLNDDRIARGVLESPSIDRVYDAGVTIGGPIKRDKLWFFTGVRRWGNRTKAAGLFWNSTPNLPVYTPDLSEPAFRDEKYQSHAVRVTWQVSETNKVNFFTDIKHDCICAAGGSGSGLGAGVSRAQEARSSWNLWPNGIIQGTWSSPVTSRLLLQAGATAALFHWPDYLVEGSPHGALSEDFAEWQEATTGFRWGVPSVIYPEKRIGDRYSEKFSLSYVTGSHNFKTGMQWDQGYARYKSHALGLPGLKGVSYRLRNGLPNRITMRTDPWDRIHNQKAELGIYAQDSWSFDKATLNLGLRFDYYNGFIPAHSIPATPWVPEREFARVNEAPEWWELNPRMGLSYDLKGDGRTALKVSAGRYQNMTGVGTIRQFHPIDRTVNSANRSWSDANGDFRPDCNLTNFDANGECGPISNRNFGSSNPDARAYADNVASGRGAWPYTMDISTEVQHEVMQGLSVKVGYYHNWDGGWWVVDNPDIDPADFTPFCVTAPNDPALPGGGGYEVCEGLWDISEEKFGLGDEVIKRAAEFGDQRRTSDFVDLTFDTRLGGGIQFGGGVSAGNTTRDTCYTVDIPNLPTSSGSGNSISGVSEQSQYCATVQPWSRQAQVKLHGSVPLPGDVMVSGTLQNLPGANYGAEWSASSAHIAESLGRPLAGSSRSRTVDLVEPFTLYEPRRTQVDLRLSKIFEAAVGRLSVNFDMYNLFNANDVLGQRQSVGRRYRQITNMLPGRLIQLSGRMTF